MIVDTEKLKAEILRHVEDTKDQHGYSFSNCCFRTIVQVMEVIERFEEENLKAA